MRKILQRAMAGTLESSDVMVEIEPGNGTVDITIDSVVKQQFGSEIEKAVREVLSQLDVNDASVYINDRGALDCTIRARVEAAVKRAEKEVK